VWLGVGGRILVGIVEVVVWLAVVQVRVLSGCGRPPAAAWLLLA